MPCLTNNKMTEMPTTYDPKEAEAKWYDYWMKDEFFEAGKRPDAETLHDCDSTSERNGYAAYRACT